MNLLNNWKDPFDELVSTFNSPLKTAKSQNGPMGGGLGFEFFCVPLCGFWKKISKERSGGKRMQKAKAEGEESHYLTLFYSTSQITIITMLHPVHLLFSFSGFCSFSCSTLDSYVSSFPVSIFYMRKEDPWALRRLPIYKISFPKVCLEACISMRIYV